MTALVWFRGRTTVIPTSVMKQQSWRVISSALTALPAVEHDAHLRRIGRTASEWAFTSSLSAHSSTRALNSSLSRQVFMPESFFAAA
jgi:hypothetical protein